MASLEAHYSVSDIEARILAALRAAGLNPEQRLSPIAVGGHQFIYMHLLDSSKEDIRIVSPE